MTEWRAIPGFPGYEVTDDGVVRRVGKGRGITHGRIVKRQVHRAGYWCVKLSIDGRQTTALVHRLVALAWIGPPPSDRHEVNHKDSDRLNPHVSNLEWSTRAENIAHARAAGRMVDPRGEAKPNHKLTEDQVAAIRASTSSHRALGEQYGVHHSTIGRIKRGEKWQPEIERVLARPRREV